MYEWILLALPLCGILGAIVTGPLFSLEARGKIGNIMVHFPWKGRKVVRQWLKPTNPRDHDQKAIRQVLAAAGKNLKAIETPKTTLLGGSKMYQLLMEDAPPGAIWNAHFVKNILEDLADITAFNEFSTWMSTATDTNAWLTQSLALGLVALTDAEIYATEISPSLQLAMGAYAAYKLKLESYTCTYDTHPSNWDSIAIEAFACDYSTVM